MKTIKIFTAALIALASFSLTSCEDWLTIYPQNKLTDEQFWEDMNDLNAVRYAAYRNFASSKVVDKILAWGEYRSDNVVFSGMSNATGYSKLLRLTDARLDTASDINDWAEFYTTINYCNQVLSNGEKVLERDPQFSKSEWRRIKAEMIALRSLNYFYLVRAFGNVPYVNKVIKNDGQVERHPQAFQSDILDSLINDVDAIKDMPRLYFAKATETRSLITKPFCYALLADMCMWRAAKYEGRNNIDKADEMYWRAYEYAVQARELMDDPVTGQYKAQHGRDNRSLSFMGKYYLEQNFDQFKPEEPNFGAWKSLFFSPKKDDEACDEIIFCMPFTEKDEVGNGIVNTNFGVVTNTTGVPFYSNYNGLRKCSPLSDAKSCFYDLRLVYSCAFTDGATFPNTEEFNPQGFVMKYRPMDKNSYEFKNERPTYTIDFNSTNYTNFIIYRKSDILYTEAEAICHLKRLNGAHAGNVKLEDVIWVVEEHRRRSFYTSVLAPSSPQAPQCMPSGGDAENFSTPAQALKILLDDKQLEFVGEGKRWFDIVRYMERTGATAGAIASMFGEENSGEKVGSMYKHAENAKRLKSNSRCRWAFYNPVYYPEREASGYVLYQNPYWDDDPTNNDPEGGEPVKREVNPDEIVSETTPSEPAEE